MLTAFVPLIILVVLCLILPLLGAVLGHQPLEQFLHLPLTGRSADALPPDLPMAIAASILLLGSLAMVLWTARPLRAATELPHRPRGAFPRWGWAGVGAVAAAMLFGIAGLNGSGLIALLAGLTLWSNADTERRTGVSMISGRPGFVVTLLPAGAMIGWMFYWINLFLQLWSTPSADDTLPFVLVSTLEFACLLPALLSLRQWLASFPALLLFCSTATPISFSGDQQLGWLLVGLGAFGLAGGALWSDWIFPLTWTAPLLLAIGFQLIRAVPTLCSGITHGDWSRILLPTLAAVLLGLIIRGWDMATGPETLFHLPRIDHWPFLGMPALAYAGLIPLGLFGIWVGDQLTAPWKARPLRRLPKFPVQLRIGNRVEKK